MIKKKSQEEERWERKLSKRIEHREKKQAETENQIRSEILTAMTDSGITLTNLEGVAYGSSIAFMKGRPGFDLNSLQSLATELGKKIEIKLVNDPDSLYSNQTRLLSLNISKRILLLLRRIDIDTVEDLISCCDGDVKKIKRLLPNKAIGAKTIKEIQDIIDAWSAVDQPDNK